MWHTRQVVGEEVSNETSNKTSNTKVAEKCKYLDSLRKIDQKIRVGALRPLQHLAGIDRTVLQAVLQGLFTLCSPAF